MTTTKLFLGTLAAAVMATSSLAQAGRKADLEVAISNPGPVHVYDVAAYVVNVANIGNRSATNVEITVDFPLTNTSPSQEILGGIDAMDSRCQLQNLQVVCQLGKIRRGRSDSVQIDFMFAQSAAPQVITATASMSRTDANPANNSDSLSPSLLNYDVVLSGDTFITNTHCTGQNLISFYECLLFPSSISQHSVTLLGNGSIDFGQYQGYTGQWWQTADNHLAFRYFANGQLVAEFEGYGTSSDCFQGITTFQGGGYVAAYQVCR